MKQHLRYMTDIISSIHQVSGTLMMRLCPTLRSHYSNGYDDNNKDNNDNDDDNNNKDDDPKFSQFFATAYQQPRSLIFYVPAISFIQHLMHFNIPNGYIIRNKYLFLIIYPLSIFKWISKFVQKPGLDFQNGCKWHTALSALYRSCFGLSRNKDSYDHTWMIWDKKIRAINPLSAALFWRNAKKHICIFFLSFINIETVKVIELLPMDNKDLYRLYGGW